MPAPTTATRRDVDTALARQILDEAAPAAADLKHRLARADVAGVGQGGVLGGLCPGQVERSVRPQRRRIGHRVVQPGGVEFIAQIVVGHDVATGTGAAVAGQGVAQPPEGTGQGIALGQPADAVVVGGEGQQQLHEVGRIPVAGDVALGEADGPATQHARHSVPALDANIVFYYGAVLWQSVGLSESDALLINVLSGALSIAAVIAGLLVIDRMGRKPMLLMGSVGMAITLGLIAYAFSTGAFMAEGTQIAAGTVLDNGTVYEASTVLTSSFLDLTPEMALLALVAANVYVMFFNFSWGPVMWVMLGEMFPNQIRGSGLAVSGFAQWIANFGITLSFPILAAEIGLTATYGFYAASALVSVFFVLVLVHETRGKELEQMTG